MDILNVFIDPVVLITLITLVILSTYIGYKLARRDFNKLDNALIDNAKLLKGMKKRVAKHQLKERRRLRIHEDKRINNSSS